MALGLLSYLHFAIVQIAVSVLGAKTNGIEAIHGAPQFFFLNICLIVWLFFRSAVGVIFSANPLFLNFSFCS